MAVLPCRAISEYVGNKDNRSAHPYALWEIEHNNTNERNASSKRPDSRHILENDAGMSLLMIGY